MSVFTFLRQLILFILGVAVIIDALIAQGSQVPELVVGLVLVGLVQFDNLIISAVERWRMVTEVARKQNGLEHD